MDEIEVVELSNNGKRVFILTFSGEGDPVKALDYKIELLTTFIGRKDYHEFIDMNMDNPWVRVIIYGLV